MLLDCLFVPLLLLPLTTTVVVTVVPPPPCGFVGFFTGLGGLLGETPGLGELEGLGVLVLLVCTCGLSPPGWVWVMPSGWVWVSGEVALAGLVVVLVGWPPVPPVVVAAATALRPHTM